MTVILNLNRGLLFHGILILLSLARPGQAQTPGSPPDQYGNLKPSMGVVIVALIASVFFMFVFYICVRHCCFPSSTSARGGSLRAIAARSLRAHRGLDRAVIDSFPTFDYSSVKELKIGKGALECAVCLNEFEDNDTLRLIPKCDHVFHSDCIDAWLVAHTTCPVCRSDLVNNPESEASENAPLSNPQENDAVSETMEVLEESHQHDDEEEGESMEQPLQRNRTMRRDASIGRSRWLRRMRFARSFSTGHVAVKQWENMDRFTLRLPGELREQLMSGKLVRSTSMVVLPRETSTRRTGYRTGFEGSSRGGRFGSVRDGQSNGWLFSLIPQFFSRASSVKSPKVPAASSRQGSLRGSIRGGSTRLPV